MNIDQQPELLLSTTEEINENRRRRVTFVNGERRLERLPQVAQGVHPSNRYRDYVRDNGSTVGLVLTNAAADVNPNSSWAQNVKRKAAYFGWYRPDQCPVALLATSELLPAQIVDRSLLDERPCDPSSYGPEKPCKHALSEKAARTARHLAAETERMKGFQSEADRILGATRDQTKAIVDELRADRDLMRRVLEAIASGRADVAISDDFAERDSPRQRQQRAKAIVDAKGDTEK